MNQTYISGKATSIYKSCCFFLIQLRFNLIIHFQLKHFGLVLSAETIPTSVLSFFLNLKGGNFNEKSLLPMYPLKDRIPTHTKGEQKVHMTRKGKSQMTWQPMSPIPECQIIRQSTTGGVTFTIKSPFL